MNSRVLKYVDFKVDPIDDKNLGYFGSGHLYYRRQLEQMLSCDSCCERHQIKNHVWLILIIVGFVNMRTDREAK